MTLLSYVDGHRQEGHFRSLPEGVQVAAQGGETFLSALARRFVREVSGLLRGHIDRRYVADETTSLLLRGRPIWTRGFGRHPIEGITCKVHELKTDTLLNQLVLAGLRRCQLILDSGPSAREAGELAFIWRGLATERFPVPVDFQQARAQIGRLTAPYASPILLASWLVFGTAPSDFFGGTGREFLHVEFSLPHLFERFVAELLRAALRGGPLELEFKPRGQLLDGRSETYQDVDPDIVVTSLQRPVIVIDAKFKPHYALGGKVSREDIYQIFFYQSWLREQSRSPLPRAMLLCPTFAKPAKVSGARQTIHMVDPDGQAEPRHLRLGFIDLPGTLSTVDSLPPREVLRRHAGVLLAEVEASEVAARPTSS